MNAPSRGSGRAPRRRLRPALAVVLALYGSVMITAVVMAVVGSTPWHTPFVGTGFVVYLMLRRWDDGSWNFLCQPARPTDPHGDAT